MTLEEVKTRLRDIVAEVCKIPANAVSDDTTIDEDLQLPSIAFVELQVTVEDEFDMILDPVEVVELNRLGLIAKAIHEKLAAA